jgi:hypothetical protein
LKHYILNLWFLNINRSISEWICPKCQKKRRLVYVMTMYLRQHGLMSFISLNIPEREINLHFVNSAGLKQKASFCILLKKFIFLWFYHTIFKVLTTQILYPKCSRMHHFDICFLHILLPVFVPFQGYACYFSSEGGPVGIFKCGSRKEKYLWSVTI